MEEYKPILCIICLDGKDCMAIDESVKNALDLLLMKLPIEENKSVICNTCRRKVFEAFRFKGICMEIEDRIFPYVNSNNGAPVDLKEIYLKERHRKETEKLRSVLENQRICRLCMQVVTSDFTSQKDLEIDIIYKYIPEVNFNYTEQPIICMVCADSLKMHSSFLRNSIGIQQFENVCEDKATVGQYHITTEEINIKSEESDSNTETPLSPDEPTDSKLKSGNSLKTQPSEERKYQCPTCAYLCKKPRHLLRHQLKHKKLSEVVTYACDACTFKSKYKESLTRHRVVHRMISEVQTYRCETCNYETKYKTSIINHQRRHKDTSEINMFKCDSCTFESRHRQSLALHSQVHKDISQVRSFKCEVCNFETKSKSSIEYHRRNHKGPSEVETYKCGWCSFETRHKVNLKRHEVKHKSVSEVQMYKCQTCDFETRRKETLSSHRQKHNEFPLETRKRAIL